MLRDGERALPEAQMPVCLRQMGRDRIVDERADSPALQILCQLIPSFRPYYELMPDMGGPFPDLGELEAVPVQFPEISLADMPLLRL